MILIASKWISHLQTRTCGWGKGCRSSCSIHIRAKLHIHCAAVTLFFQGEHDIRTSDNAGKSKENAERL